MLGIDVDVEFDKEVNRLGLEAVAAIGSDEYEFAMNRLRNYFIRELFGYLSTLERSLIKNHSGSSLSHDEVVQNTEDSISDTWIWAQEPQADGNPRFYSILERKVNNFDPSANSSNPLAFFSYAISDFLHMLNKLANKTEFRSTHYGAADFFSEKERAVYNRVNAFSMENGIAEPASDLESISEQLGLEKKLLDRIFSLEFINVCSFERDEYDDDGNPVEYEPFDRDAGDGSETESTVIDSEMSAIMLYTLNDIYTNQLPEKYRVVLSLSVTNSLITELVRSHNRGRLSFENALREYRSEIDLEGIREQLRCFRFVDESVFDMYEREQRRITDRELAASVGMSPSAFLKAANTARKLLVKKLRERLPD